MLGPPAALVVAGAGTTAAQRIAHLAMANALCGAETFHLVAANDTALSYAPPRLAEADLDRHRRRAAEACHVGWLAEKAAALRIRRGRAAPQSGDVDAYLVECGETVVILHANGSRQGASHRNAMRILGALCAAERISVAEPRLRVFNDTVGVSGAANLAPAKPLIFLTPGTGQAALASGAGLAWYAACPGLTCLSFDRASHSSKRAADGCDGVVSASVCLAATGTRARA